MTAFLLFLRSPLGRSIAEGVGALLIVLCAWWAFASHYEAKGAARVQASIDAPRTGWRDRLAQCDANGVTLQASLDHQNAALDALAAQGRDDTAKAQKAAGDARALAEGYRRQSASIGASKPVGIDACSRLFNVDQKVVGSLK